LKTIILKNFFNNSSFLISTEKGNKLYDEIIKNFEIEEKIILDFSEIKSTTTAFFFAAYGQLFSKYPKEKIEGKICFINTKDSSSQQIETVTDTSLNFYNKGE
jgi:hypothetical protein